MKARKRSPIRSSPHCLPSSASTSTSTPTPTPAFLQGSKCRLHAHACFLLYLILLSSLSTPSSSLNSIARYHHQIPIRHRQSLFQPLARRQFSSSYRLHDAAVAQPHASLLFSSLDSSNNSAADTSSNSKSTADTSSSPSTRPTKNNVKPSQQSNPAQRKQQQQPSSNKTDFQNILHQPIGSLDNRSMIALCNSIRFVSNTNNRGKNYKVPNANEKGSSLWCLTVLERILMEIALDGPLDNQQHQQQQQQQHQQQQQQQTQYYIKSIHIFSVLTALSNDLRSHKHYQQRIKHWEQKLHPSQQEKVMDANDIQRLKHVVTLLYQLHTRSNTNSNNSNSSHNKSNWDSNCVTQDVPSFATMIAAEASRNEKSGVDAALFFLDMMEKMEATTSTSSKTTATTTTTTTTTTSKMKEQDPRLIGAVLNALAQCGRAEEAQLLLEKEMGVEIISVANDENRDSEKTAATGTTTIRTKRLNPSDAGPCYDALLRAWSKRALQLAQDHPHPGATTNSRLKKNKGTEHNDKRISNDVSSSSSRAMAQARHILLGHMPLQPKLPITNRSCSAVLQGYASLGMGKEAHQVLMEMESLMISREHPSSLDVACYNSVLHGYCQSQQEKEVASAEKLFNTMKDQIPIEFPASKVSAIATATTTTTTDSSSRSTFRAVPPKPDIISYASLLHCYSKHGMATQAEHLLNSMSSPDTATTKQEKILDPPSPTIACYLSVMQAFENSSEDNAPHKALALLEQMEHAGNAENLAKRDTDNKHDKYNLRRVRPTPRMPNRVIYNYALRCMSKHGRGEEAEIILKKFHEAYPGALGPDIYSYTLALRAWERTGHGTSALDRGVAAGRAKVLFDRMQDLVTEGHLPRLEVNSYNVLLSCFAKAGMAEEAEQLLAELELENGGWGPRPSQMSHNMVIKAISRSDAKDAVDRAWKILYRLGYPNKKSELANSMNISIETFNAMLKLFAKRGMASEAEDLLNTMDELKMEGKLKSTGSARLVSYESVLEALGRSKNSDAPKRAEALVTRMEVIGELGGDFQPSLLAYNTLLNCYANAGIAGKAERLLDRITELYETGRFPSPPDAVSFGSTIKAITNSGKSQDISVARAEALTNILGGGNEIIYALRLKLFAKWGMGGEAEQLLRQMEEEHSKGQLKNGPSVIHYTCALNAWAKSTDENASEKAKALFLTMESNPEIQLDLAAYHGLLLNYSLRGQAAQAQNFLDKRIMTSQTPNRNTFTMVIDAYTRSKSSSAGEKAEKLLNKMRELHAAGNSEMEPDDVTYASIIRCKRRRIRDMTEFEKFVLMRELQIETWPFQHQSDYKSSVQND